VQSAASATVNAALAHDFAGIPAHFKVPVTIQSKLAIDNPADNHEQEANRIANDVDGAPIPVQRVSQSANGHMNAAPASIDRVLASPGKPLELALRQDMEPRFGHDFSRVRVHSGTAAEQSARDVNAHAYTVAHDIVFGAGRFAPETLD